MVEYSGRVIQTCLHGPSGSRLGCTSYRYVAPGNGIQYYYSTSSKLVNGTYCAVTWKEQPDGSTVEIGQACLNVSV